MRREEVKCRFCDGDLPDWKPVLTPAADEVAKALPTMSVTFNGQARRAPPPSPGPGPSSWCPQLPVLQEPSAWHVAPCFADLQGGGGMQDAASAYSSLEGGSWPSAQLSG